MDLDEEVKKRQEKLYIPNWFSADVKTGVSSTYTHCKSIPVHCMYIL